MKVRSVMAKGKGFELIPRAVPTRQRSSFYKEIIAEFLDSGERSVAIAGIDRKPVTVVQGLRKVLETERTKGVKVVQRSQEIFLTKE
jgi:hypothetical protein